MSKETNANPFAGFDLLNGGLGNIKSTDDNDDIVDDVISGDADLLDDEDSELGDNASAADKALEKVVEKQSKASKTKVEELETEETDLDTEEEPTDEGAGFKPALTHLSEKGILDFNDSDIEDSEEGFEKAITQTIDKRFEKLLHNKLGEEGLALLNFVENGGNPKQFIEAYYNDASWEDYSIEDNEAAQKIVIRESLRADDYEPEEIEDMISEFTDNGTLEKRAKTHLNKLQKLEATNKKQLIELQKNKAEQDKAAEKKYWEDFKSNILNKDEIKGFKLTPKVKENLVNFFTVTDKKTGKTGYQKAVESDSDAALLFGLQAMNNFDISKLEKQVVTKAASKLNSIMKNYQPSTKDRISSGRTEVDTEGTNPFAGFKKLQ